MASLNWIDYAIIAIIGLSGLMGLVRGLIREVFSLAAWGAAVWVGLHYAGQFSVHLEPMIALPSARATTSFAILFFATLLLAGLLGFILNKLVQGTGLSGTDRLTGLMFGISRGALLMAILVLLGGLTPLPRDPWWKQSKLIPPFQSLAFWLRDQVPPRYLSFMKSPILTQSR